MRPFFILGAGIIAATALRAEPVRFSSGTTRTALVELFTSEGCSSCPPTERWLGALREAPGLWRDFVPVAFHVDYWNRLGWPDRFSTREFTAREYEYAAAWQSGSVYTPCVVRNGAEWQAAQELPRSNESAGTLTVTYDGTVLRVEFSGKENDVEAHAAILGAGITSHVTAGENSGESLRHEFVALVLVHGRPGGELTLKVPKTAGVPRHALAVWITRRGSLTPLQATGGWLD